MATEKRLIDADALMERFRIVAQSGGAVTYHVSDICAAIEDEAVEEGVDAVEVVRCKDCKHYKPRNQSAHWKHKEPCCSRSAWIKFPPDGFCSYGERRTNERKAD